MSDLFDNAYNKLSKQKEEDQKPSSDPFDIAYGKLTETEPVSDDITITPKETAVESLKAGGRGVIEAMKMPSQLAVMGGEQEPTNFMDTISKGLKEKGMDIGSSPDWVKAVDERIDSFKAKAKAVLVDVGQYGIDYWNKKKETPILRQSGKAKKVMGGDFMDHPFTRTFIGASESIPTYGAGIALTLITKNPATGLTYLSMNSAASSYEEMRTEGVDPDTALLASAFIGSIEAATEKIPMDMLLKGGVKKLITRAIQQGTAESFQELFATLGQNYVTEVAKNSSIEDKEGLEALKVEWNEITNGWQDSMAAGFLLGAGGGVVSGTGTAELA